MSRQMTEEELDNYMNVAQKTKIFVEKYVPDGLYMETTHYRFHEDNSNFVTFETRIYGRNKSGDAYLMANGTATENRTTWSNANVEPDRFCETSSRGRALSALGIGLTSMSSREDIEGNFNYRGPEVKANVPGPKPMRSSVKDAIKRLKIEFEETDDSYRIKYDSLPKKSRDVLSKYGFKKVDDMFLCKKGEE